MFPGILWVLTVVLSIASGGAGAADLRNGKDINELCAGCHGEFGQGGKDGKYPRLAGQPQSYLIKQLQLFRERRRPNLAMIEYVDHRQMPDPDILDISVYLEAMELPSRMPALEADANDFNAFERLQLAKKVVQIPPAPGNPEAGARIYRKECASCHGRQAEGDRAKGVPMLAGQYTQYLWGQVDKYLEGLRIHDEDAPTAELLAEFSREELTDVLAYLAALDD